MRNNSGWRISDASIRSGLEQTFLIGRSHFLAAREAEVLGLPGATILLDGGAFIFLSTMHSYFRLLMSSLVRWDLIIVLMLCLLYRIVLKDSW